MEAIVELEHVTKAELRFSESIDLNNETAMLAAADELQAATTDATMWLIANRCPDAKLRAHVAWMLNTCAEVALVARLMIADPASDTEADMDHLRNLLSVFDLASELMDSL